ncbi:hypothetical protein K438DRAFT_1768730 [Mycena galopus ATCC 62051]|nr:hypothetical protein K438DRAFT_1768730 [Mycena galopus ATCC 62051]
MGAGTADRCSTTPNRAFDERMELIILMMAARASPRRKLAERLGGTAELTRDSWFERARSLVSKYQLVFKGLHGQLYRKIQSTTVDLKIPTRLFLLDIEVKIKSRHLVSSLCLPDASRSSLMGENVSGVTLSLTWALTAHVVLSYSIDSGLFSNSWLEYGQVSA